MMAFPLTSVMVEPTNNFGPSDDQWNKLLDFLSCDREMRTGMFEGPQGKVRLERKWNEAAKEANKLGNAKKTGDKWKEAWDGLRTRAKKAYNARRSYMLGTGGGVAPEMADMGLNPVYQRALILIGVTSLSGNTAVPDPLEVQLRRDVNVPQHVQQQQQQTQYSVPQQHQHQMQEPMQPQVIQQLHQQPIHSIQHQHQTQLPMQPQVMQQVHQQPHHSIQQQHQYQTQQPMQPQVMQQVHQQPHHSIQQQHQYQTQQPTQPQVIQQVHQQPHYSIQQQHQYQTQQPMQPQVMQQVQMPGQPLHMSLPKGVQPHYASPTSVPRIDSKVLHTPPFNASPSVRKRLSYEGSGGGSVDSLSGAVCRIDLQSPLPGLDRTTDAIQLLNATISSAVDSLVDCKEEMKISTATYQSTFEACEASVLKLTDELSRFKGEMGIIAADHTSALTTLQQSIERLSEELHRSNLSLLQNSVDAFCSSVATLGKL